MSKLLIQPLDQRDYYAVRDAVDLAITYLEQDRKLRRLMGLPVRSGKGPLQRRLEKLQPKLGVAEWV